MKSKAIKRTKESEYPRLMISEEDRIVLFTDSEIGTVISGPDEIGRYSENWSMSQFKPFYGEVILSDE